MKTKNGIKPTSLPNITKEKMLSYEAVRQSGITNMFDIRKVMELSGLEREEVLDIMKNYLSYMEKYKIERS